MTDERRSERHEDVREERAGVRLAAEDRVEATEVGGAALQRAFWFSIFGGAIIALATSILLAFLGFAIGMTTIDPAGESPSVGTLTIASGIWWLGTGIVSLFVGGWATARLSGISRGVQSATHGAVTWGLFTVVTLTLMAFTATAALTGAFRVVKTAASTLASGAQTVAQAMPEVSLPTGQRGDAIDIKWNEVRQEAEQLLRQTEKPQLQPQNLQEDAQDIEQELQQAAQVQPPAAAADELESALAELRNAARTTVEAADEQAVVNVLVARTDMSEQEARRTVNRWSDELQTAWQDVRQAAGSVTEDVSQAATAAAEDVSDALAQAAWWSFFYLLLTAMAAVGGALLGTSRRRVVRTTRREVAPLHPAEHPV